MANVFLNGEDRDIETAIMLEKAIVTDIGNAVAYTDGDRIFINTDDNLFNILPAYDNKMLKWLLWHERMHKELRHHNRFFKYLEELDEAKTEDKFQVTKEEVNIIMDILVHDSLAKMFPELVETAVNNLAQMRNRNSLTYTFKANTLEEMLDEYRHFKHPEEGEGDGEEQDSKEGKGKPKETDSKSTGDKDSDDKKEEKKTAKGDKKGHKEGGEDTPPDGTTKDKPEDGEPDVTDDEPEHDKTDWSKLEQIDSKEFISQGDSEEIMEAVNELKRKKLKLSKLTETLNGLVTSTRKRTYAKPSPIRVGGGVVLKGSTPGRAQLYLCFDASGSMGYELDTFKEIIQKSIPQALDTPCEWFTYRYGKGKFKDILPIEASSGYEDDGDRTIDLCWKAEQKGYSPIGITDGGGKISWSRDKLKQLKRTVLVGQNKFWLDKAKQINPNIQILNI